MNKLFTKIAGLSLGLALAIGVGVAVGSKSGDAKAASATEYDESLSIASDDVVTNSSYTAYTTTVSNRQWVITFGGNNKSVGTNSGNRSKCNLSSSSYSKYAVSPVTTSSVAAAFTSTASISDIGKISYTFSGGSNQTNTKVYVIYSSNGTTFTQLSLTSGTQGVSISSGASFEFAKCTGYFAVLFAATNSSGNWRIDSVGLKFYTPQASEFHVTYNGNENTGGNAPTDNTAYTSTNNTVTLLGKNTIVKANASPLFNYTFGGWTLNAEGTGTVYGPGDGQTHTYTISADVTFYAKWIDPRTSVTLSASAMNIAVGDPDKAPTLTSSPSGHTSGYTLTSATTSVATIIDNKVHAVAKGSSVITVHIDDDSSYKYTDTTFTVTVTQTMADNGTGTINFGSASGSTKVDSTSVTGDDSQTNTWTITTVMSQTSFTQNASYSQIGSSDKPATSITFTTTLAKTVKITHFSAKFGGFNGTAGNVSLEVGETEVSSGSLNGASDVTVGGDITDTKGNELTVTVTSIAKGVKVYYISYDYITEIAVTGVTVSPTEVELAPNGTQQLTPTVSPNNATNKNVTYSSDDTDVATVSPSGLITAKADGDATITVTTVDGSYTATCDVTVVTPAGAYVTIQSSLLGIETDIVEVNISYGGTFESGLDVVASNSNVQVDLDDNGDGTGTVTVSYEHAGTATISFVDGSDPIENEGSTCSVTVIEKLNAINYKQTKTSNLTFTAAYGEGPALADDGASWTVTSDGAESSYMAEGIHYGTNNASVTYVQLSSSSISGTVKSVTVNARDAQSNATASVTVGGKALVCTGSASLTSSSSDFVFTGSESGQIIVRIARSSSMTKAINVKSVIVTYISNNSTNIANTNATVQQEVLDFVTTMNSDLSVCSGSSVLSTSVWNGLAGKFETASSESSDSKLFENMLKYADATPRAADGSATTGDSLQNALARYNYVLEKYGITNYSDFLHRADVNKVVPKTSISILTATGIKNTSAVIIIVVISAISAVAVGGYFLFRKKKEN